MSNNSHRVAAAERCVTHHGPCACGQLEVERLRARVAEIDPCCALLAQMTGITVEEVQRLGSCGCVQARAEAAELRARVADLEAKLGRYRRLRMHILRDGTPKRSYTEAEARQLQTTKSNPRAGRYDAYECWCGAWHVGMLRSPRPEDASHPITPDPIPHHDRQEAS